MERKTILLVEDEAIQAMMGKMALEKYGYAVLTAVSGEKAVTAVETIPEIDLILMDIDLGSGIDGTQAAERILAKHDIPVVFLSSHMEPEIVVKTEKITSYGYVVKNSSITVLDASIKMAFKLFEARTGLVKSELKIQNKLKALLDPEGDTDSFELSDIIDLPTIQSLLEDFYNLTGILGAILDINGKILVAAGWQDICTKFHRRNPITAAFCTESDNELTQGVPAGTFRTYRCKNNMRDMVTPLIIDNRHVGNVFLGQFMYEDEVPDMELFRKQARTYGFDETEYLAALSKVPRMSAARAETAMKFYSKLALMISNLSYGSIKIARSEMAVQRKNEELARAGDTLRRNEARYRALFEKSNDAIFVVDTLTGRYLDANKAAEQLTCRPVAEIRTLKTSDLTPLEAGERLNALTDASDTVLFDNVQYIQPDGSSRLASLATIALPDNTAFGIAHDVTDLKHTLEALRRSEAKNQALFDKSVVSMALVGMDKRFIDCNEAFCSFTGYTKEEMRDKTIADITYSEDIHKGYAEMKQLAEGCLPSVVIEKRYVHKSGTVLWGELNICLLGKEEAAPPCFLASIVDITERKKAQDSDKLLIAEKEMMLKEVHHRIKNNMRTINALLVLQAGNMQDKVAIQALEEAGNRVRSMELLYERIYAATNYTELGIGEYLSPLIDDIISNFPNRADVKTEKTFADFAIPVKMLQPLGIIVNELLTNIMKYAFAGRNGGTISVSASKEKNNVTLAIQDDGNGMPETVSFEHSTGFGLVLINGLTRQLGGTIRIERGNGTRIVLEFEN